MMECSSSVLNKFDTYYSGNDEPINGDEYTVIVPIRSSDCDFYLQRLKFRDKCDLTNVSTLIVDDGSPEFVSKTLKAFCVERKWNYVKIASEDVPFSLARARNTGLDYAKTEWVYTDDADMIYERGFFQKIRKEISSFDTHPFNFLTIPAVYLSDKQTQDVWNSDDLERHVSSILSNYMIENPRGSLSNEIIQHYAPSSAILVLRRHLALQVGGYDETFAGWGGEDRDFVYRLLKSNKDILMPDVFDETKSWNLNDTHVYEGWRSVYRMMGDFAARKGLYSYHPYHPVNEWRGEGTPNLDIAAEKAKMLARTKKMPTRAAVDISEDVVVGFNPFLVDPRVLETLSNPSIIDEDAKSNPEQYAEAIAKRSPNSVIMWNPYGSSWRLKVYEALKARGINAIVGERGALPDTVYFDRGGLCIVSDSYDEQKWNVPLADEEKSSLSAYLDNLRFGDAALEKQSNRIGVYDLRKKLNIDGAVKIFLAPLQLYDDTVTTLFSETGRSYQDYISEISKIAVSLPSDWVLVYKNHPLSIKMTEIDGAICADNFHINDLMEACSLVSVFNSGTGLLASVFDKFVIHYGPCFYNTAGINANFSNAKHAIEIVRKEPSIDIEVRDRFFYYLSHKFYSFAKMYADEAVQSGLSKRSKIKEISYYKVKIPGFKEKMFETEKWNPHFSVLFDMYRYHRISVSDRKSKIGNINFKTACIEYHKGNYADAIFQFNELMKREPNSAQILRSAAEAHISINDYKSAKLLLDKAVSIIPNNKSLLKRRRRLGMSGWKKHIFKSYKFSVPTFV